MLSMDDFPLRNEQAITRTVGEEVVVYGSDGQIHQLNVTASRVWLLCDGTRPMEQIAGELAQGFDVPPERAFRDLTGLLDRLQKRGLVRLDGNPTMDNPRRRNICHHGETS